MLHTTVPPSYAQLAYNENSPNSSALSSYTPDGNNWYTTQLSDLNSSGSALTLSLADPQNPISVIAAAPFTIPSDFFGAHVSGINLAAGGSSIATLAAAGVKSIRLRDTNTVWGDGSGDISHNSPSGIVFNCTKTGISFNVSNNTVNWSGHGLTNAQGYSAFPGTAGQNGSSGTNGGSGFFVGASGGATLPSGLSPYTMYYVVNSNWSVGAGDIGSGANTTFQLATSIGGSPIAFGTAGSVGSGAYYGFGTNVAISDPRTKLGLLDWLTINAAGAFNHGMDVVFDCSTPPASANGGNAGAYLYTCPTDTNFITHMWNYLYKYYGVSGTMIFEIWNEPNDPGYFTGGRSGAGNGLYTYGSAIKAAITSISGWTTAKMASPSWTHLSSSATMTEMFSWLSGASGSSVGSSIIDYIAYHDYGDSGDYYARSSVNVMQAFQTAYNAYITAGGTAKPIWITEGGDSSPSHDILWRTHLVAAALGVKRKYHYNYDCSAGGRNPNMIGSSSQQLVSPWIDPSNGLSYSWPVDHAAEYRAMITACAGQSCGFLNMSKGYQIGFSIGSVASPI